MATAYSSRHSKPLGAGRHAFDGAGLNLGVEHLAGETELAGAFDDFAQRFTDRPLLTASTGGIEDDGWIPTQVGVAVASGVNVNDPAAGSSYQSAMQVDCGTAADTGGNLQLMGQSIGFPHVWWDSSGVVTHLDQTVLTFAARVGIESNTPTFDGKLFIGFAIQGDTSIMTPTTGEIAVAGAGPQVGFHFNADPFVTPNISLIAKRLGATALADGVNFTNIVSGVGSFETGLTATHPRWFDVAFRMIVTDASDAASNGAIKAYFRRVPLYTSGIADVDGFPPGSRENNASAADGGSAFSWREHDVTLLNQAPFNAQVCVPTIEAINGPTSAEFNFLLDWWSMGISRRSLAAK